MRWVSIVGARPQFIKIATVCRAVAAHNARFPAARIEDLLVHTGQHYDSKMSGQFFEELGIPEVAINLAIGSGSHGLQTGRMLEGIEAFLLQSRPDLVVVYGDTNSTLAGALAAVKLHIPVAHVESGLRSHNRRMPEEINRIATDHVSDLLLAPTPAAMGHLEREGLAARSRLVGDVMFDAVLHHELQAHSRSKVLSQLGLQAGEYGVVTLHRAETTDSPELARTVEVLDRLAQECLPLVFPVHPRTRNVIAERLLGWAPCKEFRLVEPLGYLDMLRLVGSSRLVLTDSGGLQKEAYFLGRPCITLRSETEWVETVEEGWNVVTGLSADRIEQAAKHWLATDRTLPQRPAAGPFGDGTSASAIVELMHDYVVSSRP